MSRYAFVPIVQPRPRREPLPNHARRRGFSGRIEGDIETLTPFYTRGRPSYPGHASDGPQNPFQQTPSAGQARLSFGQAVGEGGEPTSRPAIPGASLKGMLRSVVEAIAPDGACLPHADPSHCPPELRPCRSADALCIACRTFGRTLGQGGYQGRGQINDALATAPFAALDGGLATLTGLYSPRPGQSPAYLESGRLVGRKFYPHPAHAQLNDVPLNGSMNPGDRNRQQVRLVRSGAVFRLLLHFDGLSPAELALLLDALILEEGVAHKIGMGKPLGLGSVEVRLSRIEIEAADARLYGGRPAEVDPSALGSGPPAPEIEATELNEQLRGLRTRQNSARAALCQIWRFPGQTPLTPT